jgi:hypothetical protein
MPISAVDPNAAEGDENRNFNNELDELQRMLDEDDDTDEDSESEKLLKQMDSELGA